MITKELKDNCKYQSKNDTTSFRGLDRFPCKYRLEWFCSYDDNGKECAIEEEAEKRSSSSHE